MNIDTLVNKVSEKALLYARETETNPDDEMLSFPLSIVEFVVEYAINESHFPADYSEEKIAARLDRCCNALAMACVDVYARIGAEGEKAHNENGVSRTYDGAWVSSRLHDVLPNYVGVI